MIRAFITDFGGVLMRTRTDRARRALEQRLGLTPYTLENRVFGGEASLRGQSGLLSEEKFWREIARELEVERIGLTPQAFHDEFFADDFLDADLVAFIRSVRPRLKTGLISNTWSGLRAMLHTTVPIADAFDALVLSAEEQLLKPDPRIYQVAFDRLEVRADEAIFLDDVQENVDAGNALGMHGVRFKSTEQAVRDIRARLS